MFKLLANRQSECGRQFPHRLLQKLLALIACALVSLPMLPLQLPAAEPSSRPNIILIMADDMGYSDLGCMGGEVATPNLDRLAKEGMLFTQFYNNAKCTTTRASLITGLYPRPSGPLLKPSMQTIPEVLKDRGYYSVLSGKWHLGSQQPHRPNDRGFDNSYGLLDGCCNFFDPAQPDPEYKGGTVRWFGEDGVRIKDFPPDFYTTDAFTDYAIGAIDTAIEKQQPFFLHICYTAPHYPLHALPEDIAKYRGRYQAGWTQLRHERHRRQLELNLISPQWDLPQPDKEVKDWASIKDQDYMDHLMATYAAMIDRMDQNIGRLLEKLDASGQRENTVVMFLADNGGCSEQPGGIVSTRTPGVKEFYTACGPGWAYAQNTPFRRFKSYVHEGGISTPLLVRWPAHISPGTRCDAVGHIIDLLPTCLAIADTAPPATKPRSIPKEATAIPQIPIEGLSLLPLFFGETRIGHETLYWEWSGNRAVRRGDWKLCWDQSIKEWELYNIPKDRTEMHNLAAEHPDRVAELSEAWYTWAKETGTKYATPKR